MAERESQSFPTNHISREDLNSVAPNRTIVIDSLTDEQLEQIAHEIGGLRCLLDSRFDCT